MSATQDFEQRIADHYAAEAPYRAPDWVLARVVDAVTTTPQRRTVLGRPWRTPIMPSFAKFGLAAVAIVAIVVVGLTFVQAPGVGVAPSPTPAASPTATPRPDPDGDLAPGRYAAKPLPVPNQALTVSYTVPEGWSALGGGGALAPFADPGTEPPGGMMIQFIDVTTLNRDPCRWSGSADDVSVGPAVDDLVDALRAQTAYEVTDPIDVSIGGYQGTRVDIVMPTESFQDQTPTAAGCHNEAFRPWSTTAHGETPVYAQGPANRWQTNILDVDGTRLVIVVQDFPGTSPEDRAELDAIVESFVIEP